MGVQFFQDEDFRLVLPDELIEDGINLMYPLWQWFRTFGNNGADFQQLMPAIGGFDKSISRGSGPRINPDDGALILFGRDAFHFFVGNVEICVNALHVFMLFQGFD